MSHKPLPTPEAVLERLIAAFRARPDYDAAYFDGPRGAFARFGPHLLHLLGEALAKKAARQAETPCCSSCAKGGPCAGDSSGPKSGGEEPDRAQLYQAMRDADAAFSAELERQFYEGAGSPFRAVNQRNNLAAHDERTTAARERWEAARSRWEAATGRTAPGTLPPKEHDFGLVGPDSFSGYPRGVQARLLQAPSEREKRVIATVWRYFKIVLGSTPFEIRPVRALVQSRLAKVRATLDEPMPGSIAARVAREELRPEREDLEALLPLLDALVQSAPTTASAAPPPPPPSTPSEPGARILQGPWGRTAPAAPPAPPARPPMDAAGILAGLGLRVEESMTTPKAGKQPRPVWVVRGTVKEMAPVLKAAGGSWWAGAWSFYSDPSEKLAHVRDQLAAAAAGIPFVLPPPPPPTAEAAQILASYNLTVTEEQTTPGDGKKPRPVWVVRGTVREMAPAMKAAGGRWWNGAWSFYEGDPSAALAAALTAAPPPPPSQPAPAAEARSTPAPIAAPAPAPSRQAAPAAPAALTGTQLPEGVKIPAVWRKILALPLSEVPPSGFKRSVYSAEVAVKGREIFSSLKLHEIHLKRSRGSSYLDVSVPSFVAPEALRRSYQESRDKNGFPYRADPNHPLTLVYQVQEAVTNKVDKILGVAFPEHNDRSDTMTDYFDFVFMRTDTYEPSARTAFDPLLPPLPPGDEGYSPGVKAARIERAPVPRAAELSDLDRRIRAEKFRAYARKARNDAHAKRTSGTHNQTPTRRRIGIMAQQGIDADNLELVADKMDALAAALEGACDPPSLSGCLPESLSGIDTRKLFHDLVFKRRFPAAHAHAYNLRKVLEETATTKGLVAARRSVEALLARCDDHCDIPLEYLDALDQVARAALPTAKYKHDAQHLIDEVTGYRRAVAAGLGTVEKWDQAVRDVQALGKPRPVVPEKDREIQKRERDLFGVNIPGYFPTPKDIVARMLDLAEGYHSLSTPGLRVLEPSAGKGDIAAGLRARGADPDVVEWNHSLRELLQLKGFRVVADDFLAYQPGPVYDLVVMNPPFEELADIDHVRHAFELLRPGGGLVAIMGAGPFFRSDKKAERFRAWLEAEGGVSEQLPDGAFLKSDRPTGVATRLVWLGRSPHAHT